MSQPLQRDSPSHRGYPQPAVTALPGLMPDNFIKLLLLHALTNRSLQLVQPTSNHTTCMLV